MCSLDKWIDGCENTSPLASCVSSTSYFTIEVRLSVTLALDAREKCDV